MDQLVLDFNIYIETKDKELLAYILTSSHIKKLIKIQKNKLAARKYYGLDEIEDDEVISQLYMKLIKTNVYAFNNTSHFCFYMNKIISSVLISSIRKNAYKEHELLTNFENDTYQQVTEDTYFAEDLPDYVQELFKEYPYLYKHLIEEYSISELAREYGITYHAMRDRIKNKKEKLRNYYNSLI